MYSVSRCTRAFVYVFRVHARVVKSARPVFKRSLFHRAFVNYQFVRGRRAENFGQVLSRVKTKWKIIQRGVPRRVILRGNKRCGVCPVVVADKIKATRRKIDTTTIFWCIFCINMKSFTLFVTGWVCQFNIICRVMVRGTYYYNIIIYIIIQKRPATVYLMLFI